MGMCVIPYTTVFKSENTKNRSILPNLHRDGGWFSGGKAKTLFRVHRPSGLFKTQNLLEGKRE